VRVGEFDDSINADVMGAAEFACVDHAVTILKEGKDARNQVRYGFVWRLCVLCVFALKKAVATLLPLRFALKKALAELEELRQ
jgi:hypothetical protein